MGILILWIHLHAAGLPVAFERSLPLCSEPSGAEPIGYQCSDGCNTRTKIGEGVWSVTLLWCGGEVKINP